jgi:hypothetical protein
MKVTEGGNPFFQQFFSVPFHQVGVLALHLDRFKHLVAANLAELAHVVLAENALYLPFAYPF